MSAADRPARGRRWRLLAITAALTAVLLVGGYPLLAPRSDVSMPGKDATPEQVVEAYIDAINDRDYETSNALFPTAAHAPRNLFSGYERIRLKRIDDVDGDLEEHAWVHFTADFSGGDGSLQDGYWGYVLERDAHGHWRITGQGVV